MVNWIFLIVLSHSTNLMDHFLFKVNIWNRNSQIVSFPTVWQTKGKICFLNITLESKKALRLIKINFTKQPLIWSNTILEFKMALSLTWFSLPNFTLHCAPIGQKNLLRLNSYFVEFEINVPSSTDYSKIMGLKWKCMSKSKFPKKNTCFIKVSWLPNKYSLNCVKKNRKKIDPCFLKVFCYSLCISDLGISCV